jgi:3-hydroxy-3-methylglutaryl CoA synthase
MSMARAACTRLRQAGASDTSCSIRSSPGTRSSAGNQSGHIERRLELEPDDLQYSRAVLKNYGNMSSATILFVLDDIIRRGEPRVGDHAVLMAFGPGLTMEASLLRW